MALSSRSEFTPARTCNDDQPGDRKFPTANKNARKVEHANIFRRTRAQSLKVLRIGLSGELAATETGGRGRRVGCWRMEKRRTCICTGKLNIHAVQIRPPSDSFYRLLSL